MLLLEAVSKNALNKVQDNRAIGTAGEIQRWVDWKTIMLIVQNSKIRSSDNPTARLRCCLRITIPAIRMAAQPPQAVCLARGLK